MNIYLLQQDLNIGWDTYDSFVCAAESVEDARTIYPSEFVTHHKDGHWYGTYTKGGEYLQDGDDWVGFDQINQIKVTLIGVAVSSITRGVICASFNAG